MSERQRIIKHEIESIRALPLDTETHVPGCSKIKLYEGEAIIPTLKREGILESLFPLHDKEELKKLGKAWYQQVFKVQPISRIQEYFGDTVAMYFAFLGFYTMSLIPPAVIGFFSDVLGYNHVNLVAFFCVFNLVWATLFLESWKRNCATLTYQWGTIGTEQFEEARPNYYGKLSRNKITGRLEPKYAKWKRLLKFYGVSLPIVLLCLQFAFIVMVWYFWLEDKAMAFYKLNPGILGTVVSVMPSIIYSVCIAVMNVLYRSLAWFLNDWENHRLESSYTNHLIVKLVLFDFSNCFMSLFWVAFYLQDLKLLRTHLAALLITSQIIGQVIESVVPYFLYKFRKIQIKSRLRMSSDGKELSAVSLVAEDQIVQAEIENNKDFYIGTIDDYLEMFLQFGYVFLFSAVYPSAAFWALLNNITEIRFDAFKMIKIFQRPFGQPASGIGAWQIAFEILSVVAVITNCALLAMSPQLDGFKQDYGIAKFILFFVVAEHILLFVKVAISYVVPDAPDWVETALARKDYESKQAWRKERSAQSNKFVDSWMKRRPSNVEIEELK